MQMAQILSKNMNVEVKVFDGGHIIGGTVGKHLEQVVVPHLELEVFNADTVKGTAYSGVEGKRTKGGVL